MKHILYHILTLILCAFCTTANAQSLNLFRSNTLKEFFLYMPTDVCPTLSEYNRLEIIDNQEHNKEMKTHNQLGGISEMQELTNDYAFLKLSDSCDKAFKLLQLNDESKIIIVITTATIDGQKDSSIEFFTTKWKALPSSTYIDDATSKEFRHITINKDTNELTITTTNAMAIRVDGSDLKPEIKKETKTLKWNGKKFQ